MILFLNICDRNDEGTIVSNSRFFYYISVKFVNIASERSELKYN